MQAINADNHRYQLQRQACILTKDASLEARARPVRKRGFFGLNNVRSHKHKTIQSILSDAGKLCPSALRPRATCGRKEKSSSHSHSIYPPVSQSAHRTVSPASLSGRENIRQYIVCRRHSSQVHKPLIQRYNQRVSAFLGKITLADCLLNRC